MPPAPEPPAPPTVPPPVTGTPAPAAGPLARTVELRNPLGAVPNNLLVDGDFELSAVGAGSQGPWRAFAGSQPTELPTETGGLCLSGLRCAILEEGVDLLGFGTAPPADKPMRASLWAKVPAGKECDVVDVRLIGCESFGILATLKPVDDSPNAAGWCRYEATEPGRDSAVCVYVRNDLEGDEVALLDAATLVPTDGTVPVPAAVTVPPSSALSSRLTWLGDFVRRGRKYARPPEGPVELRSRPPELAGGPAPPVPRSSAR